MFPNDEELIQAHREPDCCRTRKGQALEKFGKTLILATMLAGSASAEDRAVVIGNANYDAGPEIPMAAEVLDAVPALRAAGFNVLAGEDLQTDELREMLSAVLADQQPEDRLVVVLAGHLAKSAGQTWFLGSEFPGSAGSIPDLATIGATAINLDTVLEIAAQAQGGAVVLIGTDDLSVRLGSGLAAGSGNLQIPQGVTVIRGEASEIADFLKDGLVQRGVSVPAMVSAAPGLKAEGFLAPLVPFRPADESVGVVPRPNPVDEADNALWNATRAIGSLDAYDAYLARYPRGAFAAEARSEVARLRADPALKAQLAEEAIGLTRDQRRAVQRDLAMLGFDPRGIDGVFGPGTRAAVTAWQKRNDLAVSGYLNPSQIKTMAGQADVRAKQLEAEAEARRIKEEREDNRYWDQTGSKGDEAGLRAYLKRYPDGLFAELAERRLSAFDSGREREAAAKDRAAWERAIAGKTVASYRKYLEEFPRGAFAERAKARIEVLTEGATEGNAKAKAAEDALGLNVLGRTVIERRLDQLGFKTGKADGVFDEASRRAIRQFQKARGLPATGYVDQATTVALLRGGEFKLGD